MEKTTTPPPIWKKEKCGNCGLGKWVDEHSNLDWKKKPLCLTCPEHTHYVFRGNLACSKFIKKTTT